MLIYLSMEFEDALRLTNG